MDMNRREFLRTAGGGTGGLAVAAGAAGPASAAEDGGGGGGEPDYGGWLDDVSNFDELVDATGQDEVRITVGAEGNTGNFAFDPAAVHVDPGTEVVWEWNGKGGQHNVVELDGAFESDLTAEEGVTFSQTVDEDGMIKYYCQPHRSLGMKGAVVVGSDYPTVGGGGGGDGGPQPLPDTAKTLGIATTFVMVVTLGLAYFFLKYGGDYSEFSQAD